MFVVRKGSSRGGAAVSKTDGRGFDYFRACQRAGHPVRPTAPRQPHRKFVVVGTGATTGSDDHGSVAPWGAAVRKIAVDRHRGFDCQHRLKTDPLAPVEN